MINTISIQRSAGARALMLFAALMIAGCAQRGVTTSSTAEQSFDDAVNTATDNLFAQVQKLRLPAFVARLESKIVKRDFTMDKVLDADTAHQTAATEAMEAKIAARVAGKFPGVEVVGFNESGIARAQYLLSGSIALVAGSGGSKVPNRYRIDLALTDIKTGTIVAQASANARATDVDSTPTAFHRDSPVLLKDAEAERTIAASRSSVGQSADRQYLGRIQTGSVIAEAESAYNAQRFADSLAHYERALTMPGGDQIRVHNGVYLTNWRLGRTAEAEEAFGRVVASGLASRNLSVKFLFRPNSTEFWPDANVSGPYAFWLRQIAKHARADKSCLHIIGHTSRTGSEQYNDQLSERRAVFIRQRLESESGELGKRLRSSGKGFRNTVSGLGTDDMRDALDRRVEFKVEDC